MPQTRLLSISAIAKNLGQPESTLHYWKNRFEPYLPSIGQGRHRRFRPEAEEVFRRIGELLRLGMSTEDVREELSRTCAVTVDGGEPSSRVPSGAASALGPSTGQLPSQAVAEVAAAIGVEIAKAIGSHLSGLLTAPPPALPQPMDQAEAEELRDELDMAREELSELKSQNSAMAGKLSVLEAELVRLRKDARELEKYLMSKIRAARPETPNP